MFTGDSETETSLVRLVHQGDGDAFQQLLQIHLPKIHQYANRMLGNPTDAKDIAQDVFIRFWQKSESFDPGKARLGTWLHQIAHNLCMDHFRKNGRLTGLDDQEEAAGNNLEKTMLDAQEHASVKRLIDALPERQRSALILCHYQGLANKQAAVILDVSVDALESLLSRARRSLKQKLLEQSHESNRI